MRLPMQKFREFSVALSTYLVTITNKRQRLLDIKSEISKPVNFKWDQNCRFLKSYQQPFDVMLDHQKQFDQIRIILLKTYLIFFNQIFPILIKPNKILIALINRRFILDFWMWNTLALSNLGHLKTVNNTWHSITRVISIQCNLDLVTLNLVTTCDLVTIFQIFQFSFFNLLHKIIQFSDRFAEIKIALYYIGMFLTFLNRPTLDPVSCLSLQSIKAIQF